VQSAGHGPMFFLVASSKKLQSVQWPSGVFQHYQMWYDVVLLTILYSEDSHKSKRVAFVK
jgi:hypothetical protein